MYSLEGMVDLNMKQGRVLVGLSLTQMTDLRSVEFNIKQENFKLRNVISGFHYKYSLYMLVYMDSHVIGKCKWLTVSCPKVLTYESLLPSDRDIKLFSGPLYFKGSCGIIRTYHT